MTEQWRTQPIPQATPTRNAQQIAPSSNHEETMTDQNFHGSYPAIRLHHDDLIDLMAKARLISVEGPLHRFLPKEPAWCQVLGNQIERVVRKQMSICPWDERRALIALQKHVGQLNHVYNIAEERRQTHLAKGRLRRRQSKGVSNNKTMKAAE
jgi:hypothetical protein